MAGGHADDLIMQMTSLKKLHLNLGNVMPLT